MTKSTAGHIYSKIAGVETTESDGRKIILEDGNAFRLLAQDIMLFQYLVVGHMVLIDLQDKAKPQVFILRGKPGYLTTCTQFKPDL